MNKDKPSVSIILSRNIKTKRADLELTQAQFAEKIGISVRHLSDIERSDTFPSPAVIEAIASVFDVPSYTLFLPDEVARKELIINSSMKKMLDKEINKAIDKVMELNR